MAVASVLDPDVAGLSSAVPRASEPTPISRHELAGIRSFLQRRGDLTPKARAALAFRLSEAAAADVAGAPPDRDHERFLELVAAREAARGS